ncbi:MULTISPECIES: hypothetical protein [Ignavibacterium]|jgi:hypothetical protein|uniref:hypothetical protein n=1 Tax=Ignavibacterium TaxID=795750 RepID=UPI0025C2ACC0|nr:MULTISPECIES: hypothetical protein [Ignavibacterium]MBI5660847.1 hypothetical protein [Ignavibacterium album]
MKKLYAFIFVPFILSAQSEFFENAVLGTKADFIFSLNRDFSGMGGALGFSLSNVFDIGFEYTKVSYEKYDNESNNRMFYTAYNFKSNNTYLKVLLGYSHNSTNITYYNLSPSEFTGPLLGIIVSPKIFGNNSIELLPRFNVSMKFLSKASKRDDGRNHNISVGLEFNVIPKVNKEFYFVLTPSISKSLSHSEVPLIYGFNLGLLFNIQRKS